MSQSTLQKQLQAKDLQKISVERSERTSVPLKSGSPKEVSFFLHIFIFCFFSCCFFESALSDAAKKIRDRVETPPSRKQICQEEEEVDPLKMAGSGATSFVTFVVFEMLYIFLFFLFLNLHSSETKYSELMHLKF